MIKKISRKNKLENQKVFSYQDYLNSLFKKEISAVQRSDELDTMYNIKYFGEYIKNTFSKAAKYKNVDFILTVNNVKNFLVYCNGNKIKYLLILIFEYIFRNIDKDGYVVLNISQVDFEHKEKNTFCFSIKTNNKIFDEKIIEEINKKTKLSIEIIEGKTSDNEISILTDIKVLEIEKENIDSVLYKDDKEDVNINGLKILLVEDNELNKDITVDLLKQIKAFVDTAKDGIEAVEKTAVQKNNYDVILMDISMPRMDGIKATKKIRSIQNEKICNIPIIALSADGLEEDKQKALEAGMDGYIPKPVNIEIIKNELYRVLKKIYLQ